MKILCTTDFSTTAENAVEWAFNYLIELGGGELEIIHCIENMRRADMLVSMDDILFENARADMGHIIGKYANTHDGIIVTSAIRKAHASDYIPKYAANFDFDLIVTGSTGLSNLKAMTIGSVTHRLFDSSSIPILAIPPKFSFKPIKDIIVGVGKEEVKSKANLKTLNSFLSPLDAHLHLTQILEKDQTTIEMDEQIEEVLKDEDYSIIALTKEGSINDTLDKYTEETKAGLICFLHTKRNWFKQLFHKSISREELFNIKTPLLVVPV